VVLPLLVYWPALFILSHIPIWELVLKARVSDKGLHFLVYMVLVFFLWLAVRPYRRVDWKRATVWWILLVLVCYGVLDEWLQMYVGRSCDAVDFLADLAGAVTSLVILSIFSFLPAFLVLTGSVIFILTNVTRINPADLVPMLNAAFHLFGYALFTLLWLRCVEQFFSLRCPQGRWLIISLALPAGFLALVQLFSACLGNGFRVTDVVVSSTAIGAVVGSLFVKGLIGAAAGGLQKR